VKVLGESISLKLLILLTKQDSSLFFPLKSILFKDNSKNEKIWSQKYSKYTIFIIYSPRVERSRMDYGG
jgi:hypothetical protein